MNYELSVKAVGVAGDIDLRVWSNSNNLGTDFFR